MRKGLTLKFAVIAALGLMAFNAEARKDVQYVGDGRYTCRGSDCDNFDRDQADRNRDREDRERYRREERQESRDTIDAIKENNRENE